MKNLQIQFLILFSQHLTLLHLKNTVKLFYMWDNEFCNKDENEMQRLSAFLHRYPELDTDGLNKFEFDTIEAAEIFCDVVEGYYKLRKADLPFVDGKYVAYFSPISLSDTLVTECA